MLDGRNCYKMIDMSLPNVKDFFATKADGQYVTSLAFELHGINKINMRLGYEFTSGLLMNVSEKIVEMIIENVTLYRVEGTMFLIDFEDNISLVDMKEVHEKISKYLKRLLYQDHVFSLEAAFGAVINFKYRELDKYKILSTLTLAVDKAKNEALPLVILDESNYNNNSKKIEMLEVVKNGILRNFEGYYLVYQPFVSAMNGKVIGAEALLRWKNDEYGNVSPGVFIPYIENFSCFYELGLWIIETALTDAKKIIETNPNFFININLSYSQFENENFRFDVINLINKLNFPFENIQFELTERCKNLDLKSLTHNLLFFRNFGIKIALDDFGTGTSTLRLIADLPIDCVKIDQSFIRNILYNPSNVVVVETVLDCAKKLGISVCLEGVENEEVKQFVSRYYANYHQGYYYSKPVLFEEFLNVLKMDWKTKGINIVRSNNKSSFDVNNIISMMPGGFFVYLNDETERIILANEALLDLYECSTMEEFVELTNQSFKGMVYDEDYSRISKEIVQQISESEKKYDKVKYRIVTKTGKIKKVVDYGHLVTKAYNDDVYYVFIVEEN
jgi:EAL domain-containing protein (putative c-di-GMP-specific phosphodiesterase class I)